MVHNAYLAGSGAIWIQPDGPNTQPVYLGCHALGDIEHPLGDASLVFVPDVERVNEFVPIGIYKSGGPGAVTVSMQATLRPTADWLETIDCPVPVYINLNACGRKDVFDNWERSVILESTLITSKGFTPLSVLSPDDQSQVNQSFELASKTLHRVVGISLGNEHFAGATGRTALSVVFSGPRRCYGSCGNVHSNNEDGYMGFRGVIGAQSNVYVTDNGGLNWMPTTDNPFQSWEDVSGLVNVQSGVSQYRVIAARGTIDLLSPMEIAYSEDRGATWTNVNVGTVNGQYAIGRGNPMFAWNLQNIWLVTTGGYIYFSENGGVSWTTQNDGTNTVQNLHAVHCYNDRIGYAVGENNTILRTTDGLTWELLAGPGAEAFNTAQAVYCISKDIAWVGYDSGTVWFTQDGGESWTKRDFPGSGTGQVQDIKFCNDLVGYIVHISAGGTVGNVFRTINGGWSWVTQNLPAGTGPLYDLHVSSCNSIHVAGQI